MRLSDYTIFVQLSFHDLDVTSFWKTSKQQRSTRTGNAPDQLKAKRTIVFLAKIKVTEQDNNFLSN